MITKQEEASRLADIAIKSAAHVDSPPSNPQPLPSEVLFLAWREAFLREWDQIEESLNREAVVLAKAACGDQARSIVFTQPLVVQNVQGRHYEVADLYYVMRPLWYAAHYNSFVTALDAISRNAP